jgi:fumarylacetoacetase
MTPPPPSSSPSDPTLDPSLKSWVAAANDEATEFPLQNLPLCAYRRLEDPPVAEDDQREAADLSDAEFEAVLRYSGVGVRVGDSIIALSYLAGTDALSRLVDDADVLDALGEADLSLLADLGPSAVRTLRAGLVEFLKDGGGTGQQVRRLRAKAAMPVDEVDLLAPLYIPDYTDFYASKYHASNVGAMFRPDNPLLPNYRHVPIGYHGRASSIVASGHPVRRPRGQTKADDAPAPSFGPCAMLDYEAELGLVIGGGNDLGEPVPIARAREHMLGLVLLNDWSARDLQKWEYQPLGPFLAKNFCSSISPYIVTMQALAPFRVDGPRRDEGDPAPLDYLRGPAGGGLDVTIEVFLRTRQMRDQNMGEHRISTGSAKDLYWTFDQLVAHHTSNGCNLRPGDLLGSGTISGPDPSSRGCLLELTWDAPGKPRRPIQLPSGETRTFLQDGDEVVMRAFCERPGFRRIGFGECRGEIEPA